MNRVRVAFAVFAALNIQLGCGGGEDSPTTATGVDVPAPAPVATAAPTASPSGLCANGNMPVARFDIKVYAVRDKNGDLRDFNPRGPFFVGESLRFDSQGKDRFGRRTDGCTGEGPRWSWGPEEVVQWNGLYGWMPSATVVALGTLKVAAQFEGGSLDFPLELRLE